MSPARGRHERIHNDLSKERRFSQASELVEGIADSRLGEKARVALAAAKIKALDADYAREPSSPDEPPEASTRTG